jgi:DNA recombination protein RmuC
METLIIIALCTVGLIGLVNLYLVLHKKGPDIQTDVDQIKSEVVRTHHQLDSIIRQEIGTNRIEVSANAKEIRNDMSDSLDKFGKQQQGVFSLVNNQIKHLVETNEDRFGRLHHDTVQALEKIREKMDSRLLSIQSDHNQHMEKMRETVDEKLHKTLEERLGRSFKMVSEHLEKVQTSLGEMQHLAAGVGDLKKVLANVKTRGILGEIQLLNIIEEIMTSDQYELNMAPVPGRDFRVEVAIKLPGQNSDALSHIFLPIDSKFPMDKYQSLMDAYEAGCPNLLTNSKKDLHRTIIQFAKDIRTKYIAPPYTTDFAIMFLPVEGLYAEVSRQSDLLYRLKSEYQILVAGPNNLSAFLSSLQMGFRTLAIEKRSGEVWKLLSDIKTEFGKFGLIMERSKRN